jgi:alkyldihydroxyacetonephosphate synthase
MGSEIYALWGEEKEGGEVSRNLIDYIRGKIGPEKDEIIWSGRSTVPDLPAHEELKELLLQCIPSGSISFNPSDRLRHSIGMGGLDYIQLMEKKEVRAVDAVVYPTEEEIRCLLSKRDERIEIIPYGGGTTVTGGISSSGSRKYTVSLDTAKLDFIRIDFTNNVMEAGAGLRGPKIEEKLQKYGLTLGNFPESFHYSTLGGWIATNAAGQESNRYGKIKDMVIGIRMESPAGTYQDRIVPGESAFFKLSDIAVGSEGSFGVITRAWLKLHTKPKRLFYRAYMFKSFEDGIEALRKEFTKNKTPLISRLSDEAETELSLLGAKDSLSVNLFKSYVAFRMHRLPGAMLVAVSERKEDISFDRGINLSSLPSKYWYQERYSRPFIYNELLKRGIVAETIETSALWEKLPVIYRSTKKKFDETVRALDIKGIILCHSSHQYIAGSALYFTFLFYANENRGTYLQKIRGEIIKNIISEGGSISHHHGIGNLQSQFLEEYKGKMFELTEEVKRYFDPKNSLIPGILNLHPLLSKR